MDKKERESALNFILDEVVHLFESDDVFGPNEAKTKVVDLMILLTDPEVNKRLPGSNEHKRELGLFLSRMYTFCEMIDSKKNACEIINNHYQENYS